MRGLLQRSCTSAVCSFGTKSEFSAAAICCSLSFALPVDWPAFPRPPLGHSVTVTAVHLQPDLDGGRRPPRADDAIDSEAAAAAAAAAAVRAEHSAHPHAALRCSRTSLRLLSA